MKFEWDESKARANKAKHRVEFEIVHRFEFGTALIEFDDDLNYGEDRWRAIGFAGPTVHTVIFTERNDIYRIISVRKATREEEKRHAVSF